MSYKDTNYDVIVVGGGHAGYEAALASSRMGVRTALITLDRNAIGRMSCNPSIGGIAKSHLVFELDALGGEMARNTDYTGIQFRVLNTRKGPAVQANRAQCDKKAYSARIIAVLDKEKNLAICEDMVNSLWIEGGRLKGVVTAGGVQYSAKAVVIASGTFLNGTIHIGKKSWDGGRIDEKAARELSGSLKQAGFRLGRLKTGTPPRLHKDSINYSAMQAQPGLEPPPLFSFAARQEWKMFHVEHQSGQPKLGDRLFHVEQSGNPLKPWFPGWSQIPCYLTHTTLRTHEIIANNLNESALYCGIIKGTGVRYCPSIEDKIVKFKHHDSHHVFIEPEGRDVPEVYPNGTSNSLPESVQVEMIRSIPGLEKAVFMRPGYGIEYDFSDPTQLYHTLETKLIENLYFAGQSNGTTGYEEAAGQGFIAGVNAALKIRREEPLILSRNESYIGVLIDDLVTKGTDEPYRMFTSRAEHRLLLRQDNSAFRLIHHAKRLGLVSADFVRMIEAFSVQVEEEIGRLKTIFHNGASLAQILRRPEINYDRLPGKRTDLPEEVIQQVEINTKYEGYISHELDQIARAENLERIKIPPSISYHDIKALRFEAREKLTRIRPENLGQAARISGVNPADISILVIWLKKSNKAKAITI